MKKQGPRTPSGYDNRTHGRDYTDPKPGEPAEAVVTREATVDYIADAPPDVRDAMNAMIIAEMERERLAKMKPRTTTIETVLREVLAIASAITTTPRPVPTTANEPADGPQSGRWVWWNGKRHDVPSGVVYAMIAYMWNRDAASYDDDLARNVFDDPPAPQTVRARASEATLALRRIGVPWRLRCNSTARILTKENVKNP